MTSKEQVGATLRRYREQRSLSLAQVGKRVRLGKTGVQAIETGRSGASLDRYEAIASVVGAEITVLIRDAGAEVSALDQLAAVADTLDPERLALLLRAASAMADLDEGMTRGFVEGLESWARTARGARVTG